MKWMASSIAAGVLLWWACAAAAPRAIVLPEPEQSLKAGEGREVAEGNCQSCHSLDYIQTQPPGKGAPFWSGEVKKMIDVFGATISEDDAKKIAAYLAQTY